MSNCCGQRQANITNRHRVRIRYRGGVPLAVVGPVTGVTYHFAGTAPVLVVDPRDALQILRDRRFQVVELIEPPVLTPGANDG